MKTFYYSLVVDQDQDMAKVTLDEHIESIREVVQYTCNHCEYKCIQKDISRNTESQFI